MHVNGRPAAMSSVGQQRYRSEFTRSHSLEDLLDEAPEEPKRIRHSSLARPLGHSLNPAGHVLLWSLVVAGAPIVLGQLVHALISVPGIDLSRDFDYIEFFSVSATLTSAMREAGYRAGTYDYRDNEVLDDINGDVGFAHALHLAVKIRAGGGAHAGIVDPFIES